MNEKKLKKLASEIRSLRQQAGSIRGRELAVVAEKLGRRQVGSGGHPQYISDLRPGRITIPSHSKPLKSRTALSILDDLDTDVFFWRESLSNEEDEGTDNPG